MKRKPVLATVIVGVGMVSSVQKSVVPLQRGSKMTRFKSDRVSVGALTYARVAASAEPSCMLTRSTSSAKGGASWN